MPERCKQREKILASGPVNVPALPIGAVRGYLCFRCFGPADKMLKCGACKRAGYCSKECQKIDWSLLHRKQCKLLQEINEIELRDYRESQTWAEYTKNLNRYIRIVRAISPAAETTLVVQAEPHCAACHRSAVQLAKEKIKLIPCPGCRLVHHCSSCENIHLKETCSAYQNHAAIENFRIELFEDTGQASVTICTDNPRSTYLPLNDATSWHDYYTRISDKDMIKHSVKDDFSGLTNKASPSQRDLQERGRLFLLLGTDTLTMPLTIVSALEDLAWTDKKSLGIHLLGATGREFLSISTFEEILHLLPNMKELNINAIGPDTWVDLTVKDGYVAKREAACCPKCQKLERKRSIAAFQGLYHDFISTPYYTKPDIIVCFNSGCADGDDAETGWSQTLTAIIDSDVPALFTTYNPEEARHEEERMNKLNARFVVPPGENKWKGLVPNPEFLDQEFEMWYQNHWRYVIKGRKS